MDMVLRDNKGQAQGPAPSNHAILIAKWNYQFSPNSSKWAWG
jgi:hypothetical protein